MLFKRTLEGKYKILLLNYTFELGAGPQSASEKFDCYHKMGQQKKKKHFWSLRQGRIYS